MDAARFDVSGIPGTNGYCDAQAADIIRKRMDAEGITPCGVRFFGSGNYHYLSYFVTERITEPYVLVLIDHHPDMRAPAFGEILSCGGWVRDALLKQKHLRRVVMWGADETLFTEEYGALDAQTLCEKEPSIANGTELHKRPESKKERVIYAGSGTAFQLPDLEALLPARLPVFLSVDLDVLAESEIQTDWDQGEMTLDELLFLLRMICENRRVIGADICGAPA